VRVTDIAARLGFKKASVSAALKSLESEGLVQHKRYGNVSLTEKGLSLAHSVRERHTLLKEFLIKKLGVSEGTAENDACKMEHILSKETIEKLKIAMLE
jgi:DtxR family Mn-dependent transcriptional regulator